MQPPPSPMAPLLLSLHSSSTPDSGQRDPITSFLLHSSAWPLHLQMALVTGGSVWKWWMLWIREEVGSSEFSSRLCCNYECEVERVVFLSRISLISSVRGTDWWYSIPALSASEGVKVPSSDAPPSLFHSQPPNPFPFSPSNSFTLWVISVLPTSPVVFLLVVTTLLLTVVIWACSLPSL